MRYPLEFIARVKKEFPDEPHLWRLAEIHSKDLPILLKPCLESLNPREILAYLKAGRADELKVWCEAHLRRVDLYYEACRHAFGAPE